MVTFKIMSRSFLFCLLRYELRECSPTIRHLIYVRSQCRRMEQRECGDVFVRNHAAFAFIRVAKI
jgi:hypothetical protein